MPAQSLQQRPPDILDTGRPPDIVDNQPPDLPDNEPVTQEEPKSIWSKAWDTLTTSLIPDLPEGKLINQESTGPLAFAGRTAEEMGRGIYSDLIQPSLSPAGIASAAVAGPLIRGGIKAASMIPGAAKLGGLFTKSIPGTMEAPKVIKKAASQFLPKADDTNLSPKVDTVPDSIPEPIAASELIPNPKGDGTFVHITNPLIKVDADGNRLPSVLDKFQTALDDIKPLSKEQRELLTAERAEKFSNARGVDISDTDTANMFMGKLKGQHSKLQTEPLKLDQDDVDELYSIIGEGLKSNVLDVTDSAQSIGALRKLLNGEVPNPSEVKMLQKVFGANLKVPTPLSTREKVLRGVNVAKAIASMGDIGILFRQGFNRIGQKEWRSSILPTVMSYFSEQSKDDWINAIKAMPNSDYAHKMGLAIYDSVSSAKEEFVVDSLVKNLPLVKHGNRATVVGLSKLRMELFNTLHNDYSKMYTSMIKNAGDDETLINAAKIFNPDNPYLGRKIADMVNVSTGRGKIGFLEPIAEELNATLWSPRLMSSRIRSIHRVLNPASYIKKDPVERKDALRQLVSMVGAATTTAAMLKSAGFEIGVDPRSSDFLKGKIGKTRFDMMGGYPQYFVPIARMLTGETVSSKDGETIPLNKKFGGPTYWSVAENFITNKEAPLAALITALMRGREATGQEVNLESTNPMENTAIKQFMPFMMQDLYELAKEDPNLLPLMGGVFVGGNTEVHQETPSRFTGRR